MGIKNQTVKVLEESIEKIVMLKKVELPTSSDNRSHEVKDTWTG